MSQQVDLGFKTFPVASGGVALSAFGRVKLSGGNVVAAGAGDAFGEIGTIDEATFTSGIEAGQPVMVRLRGKEGTRKMIAAGAITAGAAIYAAASQQVSATASGPQIGIALEGASGAGAIIECLYYPPPNLHLTDLIDVAALAPVQGDVPYFTTGGALAVLAPGTSGTKLTTEGAAANPIYS